MLLPFSPDVKVQQDQREKMVVMGFLAILPSEYDSIRVQILSSLGSFFFPRNFQPNTTYRNILACSSICPDEQCSC